MFVGFYVCIRGTAVYNFIFYTKNKLIFVTHKTEVTTETIITIFKPISIPRKLLMLNINL
jgi:hypothetical protein